MTPEILLREFARLSDAPDAVGRLRRLVLDLAVRGKLVMADSADGTAGEVLDRLKLARIKCGRVQRKGASKAKVPEPRPDISLPSHWQETQLSNVVTVLNGRAYKQSELLDHGTPVLRVGNLFTSKNWYYSNLELDDDKYCDAGDLIYSWSASFGPFIWTGPKVVFHYHIWKLPLFDDEAFDKNFLYLVLQQQTAAIKAAGHGISMIHMTKQKMEALQVPVPPLPEQKRIVAKVDELMALCDRLEAARTAREATRDRLVAAALHRLTSPQDPSPQPPGQPATPPETFQTHARFYLNNLPRLATRVEHVEALRKGILDLAVTGRLVPQNENEAPANDTLSSIAQVRLELIDQKALKRSQPIQNKISLRAEVQIPSTWRWVSCDQIFFVTKLAGFEYTKHFDLRDEGAVPVIRAQNVRPWKVSLENLKYISAPVSEALPRSALNRPCLLVTFIGAGIGDVAFFEPDGPWHLAPNVAKMEFFNGCEKYACWDYLNLFFNSPAGRREIYKHVKSTAQPSLSMRTLRDIDVPFPPLQEQRRIVAKVDELMALCDDLETAIRTQSETSQRLLDAAIREALADPQPALEVA